MTPTLTVSLPAPFWAPTPRIAGGRDMIQDLLQELRLAERRLAKRVQEATHRDRHEECSELLERAVLRLPRNEFRTFLSGGGYTALLAKAWVRRQGGDDVPEDGRLGASVVPPDGVASHLAAFEEFAAVIGQQDDPDVRGRADFLRNVVLKSGAGVVEAQPASAGVGPDMRLLSPTGRGRQAPAAATTGAGGRQDIAVRFRAEVAAALRDGRTVNMNLQNHVVITTVLAEFLLREPDRPPGRLRVTYADGSEALPFPLRCLDPAPAESDEQVVPFALMSMRHLLLDENVVMNWYRNREIDQSSTLAHSDTVCYRQAVRQLDALRRSSGSRGVLVHLYHTGFEPAVVGFYRAAVEAARDGGGWLRVVPHYHTDDGSVQGPSWPPTTD